MEPRISLITLGVADLDRAADFHRDVLNLPQLPTPDEVRFFDMGTMWLALYGREALAADAGVNPAGSGFPGFTLAHNVRSAAEVDALLGEVSAAGGRIVRAGKNAEWGGYTGYFADPDGYLWEVAWNPDFPYV